jgi:cytochrome c oxidase subunit 2
MDTNFRLFPPEASTFAPRVDILFAFLMLVAAFFTALIFCLVVYFGLRYRRRDPNEVPKHSHPWLILEIAWSVIPLGITMVIFFWGAVVYFQAQTVPKDAEEIFVVGKQWMWKIQHSDGRREINALHVPINRPIVLKMTSQDVIHDFGLPAFRIKKDVIPGAYTQEWFEATEPGAYHIFCDQYCGTEHANMIGTVYVMEPDKYQEWLSGGIPDVPPRVAGFQLFQAYGCSSCHGQRAPTMAGLYGSKVPLSDGTTVIADDDYIRESILYPSAKIVAGYPPVMPTYKGQLSAEQVMQLTAYIKSLAGAADTGAYQGPTGPTTQPSITPPWMGDVPSFPIRTDAETSKPPAGTSQLQSQDQTPATEPSDSGSATPAMAPTATPAMTPAATDSSATPVAPTTAPTPQQ